MEASIPIFAMLFLIAVCLGPDAIDAFLIALFLNLFIFAVTNLYN